MALTLRIKRGDPASQQIHIITKDGTLTVRVRHFTERGNQGLFLTFDGPRDVFTIVRDELMRTSEQVTG